MIFHYCIDMLSIGIGEYCNQIEIIDFLLDVFDK